MASAIDRPRLIVRFPPSAVSDSTARVGLSATGRFLPQATKGLLAVQTAHNPPQSSTECSENITYRQHRIPCLSTGTLCVRCFRGRHRKYEFHHSWSRQVDVYCWWLHLTPLLQSGYTFSYERPKQQPETTSERRSVGQKRRREREAQERANQGTQMKPVHGVDSKRVVAQRARRQRELAASIQENLRIPQHSRWLTKDSRSIAQSLRRQVDKANRLLERDPDCDPTGALDDALDAEYDANHWRRENRAESRSKRLRRFHEEMQQGARG
ncbi:hypothetical protein MKEN_01237400 [Mycena kentingensis (nom. inval.)]|nr:hypothetical protein MKEN_01237400 [Mycena kentingensis (nom. inval.)]